MGAKKETTEKENMKCEKDAILKESELLALLRVDETSKKERNEKETMKSEEDNILKEGELQKEANEKANMKCEKGGELQKEALKQASLLGDSALYRCHKKCERI